MIKSGEAIIIFGQFNDNNATTAGGAIYVYDSIACNVVESEISDSKSNVGGAICALLSLVIISKCNLSRNEAQESGGAISLSASTVHISASMIDGNNANFDGGEVEAQTETLRIYASDVAHNNAGHDGGAIHASDTDNEVYGSNFTANAAGRNGGAISVRADDSASIHMRKIATIINNCDFIENRAGTGVLYVSQSNTNLSGSIIVANNVGSIFLFSIAQEDIIEVFNNSSPGMPNGITIFQQGGTITSVQIFVWCTHANVQ